MVVGDSYARTPTPTTPNSTVHAPFHPPQFHPPIWLVVVVQSTSSFPLSPLSYPPALLSYPRLVLYWHPPRRPQILIF